METVHEYIDPAVLFSLVEEQLTQGRYACFTVTGMSMWPFLCHGRDSVTVRKAEPASLRVGDIVLLRIPDCERYLLHRVTGIRRGPHTVQTTGDGNCYRDGWFPAECVIAVVTEMTSRGRNVSADAPGQRFLSALWRILYPVRPLLLRFLRMVSRCRKRPGA